MFSPKIEIINHFDELINQVDIDIEEALKQYNENENQVLADLECFKFQPKRKFYNFKSFLSLFESQRICYLKSYFKNEYDIEDYQLVDTVDFWPESTKVVDYLNQVRMRTIDELRNAQEESLEYYKLNSARFNSLEEMFGEKYYFQLRLSTKNYRPCVFNVFTFVTDFYMSQSDIDILKVFITNSSPEIEKFFRESKPIFDEKMVLIGLLSKYFFENLSTEKYPNNVISVSKRDIQNINEMESSYEAKGVKLNCSLLDLSKLERLYMTSIVNSEEIELDGLSSLQYLYLSLVSVERFSARNLPSLKHLVWSSYYILNKYISTQIFENLSNIKELEINGGFSDINLDDLVNLEILTISGEIEKGFNFGLFKKICNNLQELTISLENIANEHITELFHGLNFPNLVKLHIQNSRITKLEKRMFKGFPMLQSLTINENSKLRRIESDAFSSLTNLVELDLHRNSIESINQKHFSQLINLNSIDLYNNRIKYIEENSFSNLKNLTKLDLSVNGLRELNPNLFIGLGNLKYLNLRCNNLKEFDLNILDYIRYIEEIKLVDNPLTNKDEIERKFKDSKITIYR